MDEIINNIIKNNNKILGNNPSINKIEVGFTNTIYNIDNKYILKICTNIANEDSFLKEINFYKNNSNTFFPKLYYSNTIKNIIPYYYEIIGFIQGDSLYKIWHKLNEKERESVIKELCTIMKYIHNNKVENIDWIAKNKKDFLKQYIIAKDKTLFTNEEMEKIERAFLLFDKYLSSDTFVLVHNDLHFDNIIYSNGSLKIIDFERMTFAPPDFELDIIYRMARKPWKFASEKDEGNVKLEDYKNIMTYIEKYYPDLINVENLYKRLAIYDTIYYIRQLIDYPNNDELKEDIMLAVDYLLKEE